MFKVIYEKNFHEDPFISFYRAAWNALTRSSDENSVCLSVYPSIRQTRAF